MSAKRSHHEIRHLWILSPCHFDTAGFLLLWSYQIPYASLSSIVISYAFQLADNIVQPIQVTPKTPYEDTSVKKKPRISVDNGGGSSSDDDEFEKKIRQLKIMLKHEVITKEEYDAKIAEILSRM